MTGKTQTLTVLNNQRSTFRHLFHKLLTQSHHVLGTQRHTADTIQLIIIVTYTTSTPNENEYQKIGHPQTNQTNGQLTLSSIQRTQRKIITIIELTLPTSRSMHQGRRRWRSDNNLLRPFRWRHTNVGRPIRLSIPHIYNNRNNFRTPRPHTRNIPSKTNLPTGFSIGGGICLTFLRLTIATRSNNTRTRTNNDRRRVHWK